MKKLLLSLMTFVSLVSYGYNKGNYELNILHINDHHSHLEEEKMTLKLDGTNVAVMVGGLPRIGQKIDELKAKNPKNTLALHAGDALVGTLYYTLFQGKADADLMNTIKFDYFTLGNHEFDDGNEVLKRFLDELKIPTVSSNVVADETSGLQGKWTPYVIKKVNGENVAIIGLDVVGKTVQSSNPGKGVKFLDEVETAKKMVEEIEKKGINKIILLSHAGYEKNVEIAEKVGGIDLIITGDTHYLIGSQWAELGLKADHGEYPKKIISPRKEPVYVAEAWNYSYMLGNLNVKFDKKGVIVELNAKPQILMGDSFFEIKNSEGKKVQMDESERERILKYVESNPNIEVVKEKKETAEILEKYKKEKIELGKKPVGKIVDVIPGGSDNRIPSDKNPEGSLATTLVAEAILHTLQNTGTGEVDFVMLNSGGVRITLNPGEFNTDQAYTLLPFTSNTIYLLKVTGEEIKQTIEDALNFVFTGGSSGAFPYGSGIRYEATKEGEHGTRVKKIEIFNRVTNKWEIIQGDKMYTMGTNSYVGKGKDGWITLGKVNAERGGVDTYLGDAKSFIDYMKLKGELGRPASSNVKFIYK